MCESLWLSFLGYRREGWADQFQGSLLPLDIGEDISFSLMFKVSLLYFSTKWLPYYCGDAGLVLHILKMESWTHMERTANISI